jgi:magnesium chelatase accessory protein
MQSRPDWPPNGRPWPNQEASRFVRAAGFRWHVQIAGSGPALLLLHGTGAATHSWRGLLPLLSPRFTVIAPDLPGHGFTDTPPPRALSLPGMVEAVGGLLRELGASPDIVVGHSAGAAVMVAMALEAAVTPRVLVSINGALLPLRGGPGDLFIFSALARMLASVPLVPWLIARRAADRRSIERLLRSTGSTIDAIGVDAYARVVSNPRHVAAALGMMAAWDLVPLARALPRLTASIRLIVGANDRTIPPTDAQRVRALIPSAEVITLPGLGHLAHEEDPAASAAVILDAFATTERPPQG